MHGNLPWKATVFISFLQSGAGLSLHERAALETGAESKLDSSFHSDAWLSWVQSHARERRYGPGNTGGSANAEGDTKESTVESTAEEVGKVTRAIGEYEGRTVYSNGHLFDDCHGEGVEYWENKGKTTQELIKVWERSRPNGFVYAVEQGSTCVLLEGYQVNQPSSDDGDVPPWQGLQVLSLIARSYDPICSDEHSSFQWVQPETFSVGGPLKQYGSKRNYAAIWPEVDACSADEPCPLVVFLSGIGEHSPSYAERDNATEFRLSFRTLHKFGFLRYYDRDKDCVEKLGTVMIFPELAREENWVKDGPDLLEYFVIPLVDKVKRPHPKRIDPNRLFIMGYSEGAFGALHGAVLYPHVFSMTVSASASVDVTWWEELPQIRSRPSKELLREWKLKTVMLALGELDNTGYQPYNLERLLDWLDSSYVAPYTSVQVRYYAGLYHKEVWDRLFNRWPLFFRIFWQGRPESSQLNPADIDRHDIAKGIIEMESTYIDPSKTPRT